METGNMSPSLALIVLIAVLVTVGLYLLMERSLTRIVIGSSLLTAGVNLAVLVAGGRAGGPPILGQTEVSEMSDPLPQAMVLTAIVIGMALTAFMVSMAYRSWQLNNHDEVQDDVEDRRLATSMAERDALRIRAEDDAGTNIHLDAEQYRDETDMGDQRHWLGTQNQTGTENRQEPQEPEPQAEPDLEDQPRPEPISYLEADSTSGAVPELGSSSDDKKSGGVL